MNSRKPVSVLLKPFLKGSSAAGRIATLPPPRHPFREAESVNGKSLKIRLPIINHRSAHLGNHHLIIFGFKI